MNFKIDNVSFTIENNQLKFNEDFKRTSIKDFKKQIIVNEQDINTRGGVFFSDGKKFLIGHAPNQKMKDKTWDIPKGHLHFGENIIEGTLREFYEETGLKLSVEASDIIYNEPLRYDDALFYLIAIKVEKLPPLEDFECKSFFTEKGKEFPEFSKYKYIYFEEYDKYLYQKLIDMLEPYIKDIKKAFKNIPEEDVKLQEMMIFLSKIDKVKNTKGNFEKYSDYIKRI